MAAGGGKIAVMEESASYAQPVCDLEHLWESFSGPLRQFIRSFDASGDEAEDILQEVFIRVHRGIDGLRDCGKIQSWIFQITRRAVFDHFRRLRPGIAYCECLPLTKEEESGDTAVSRLASTLAELLASLPEPFRTALQRSEIEGLPQKELAAALGISYSGAKSRVQRARQMVKERLLQCCHFEFDRRGIIIDYHEHCCCCAAGEKISER
jgi:RNA polymerase sigma-70 factor (ECF subfamily)